MWFWTIVAIYRLSVPGLFNFIMTVFISFFWPLALPIHLNVCKTMKNFLKWLFTPCYVEKKELYWVNDPYFWEKSQRMLTVYEARKLRRQFFLLEKIT